MIAEHCPHKVDRAGARALGKEPDVGQRTAASDGRHRTVRIVQETDCVGDDACAIVGLIARCEQIRWIEQVARLDLHARPGDVRVFHLQESRIKRNDHIRSPQIGDILYLNPDGGRLSRHNRGRSRGNEHLGPRCVARGDLQQGKDSGDQCCAQSNSTHDRQL